ncbi:type I restriction enzyme, S subunit, partial [Anaerovibrio lipolyticus DSM 3074]
MAKLIDITGKALSGEWGTDDEKGIGIPVLRTTNFTNEGVVDYTDVVTRIITKKNISEKYLKPGDIIIEKSGGSDKQPVGRVIYFNGPEKKYLFNNFTGLLRVKEPNKWFPKYVFYSLFGNYRRGGTLPFENKTTGLHNLKTDDYVSRYEVKEAKYSKQIEISEYLDKLYFIIKMREKELVELDTLIKARFIELFEDGQSPIRTVEELCSEIVDCPHT